jgi:SAM-dependent methyltransferase
MLTCPLCKNISVVKTINGPDTRQYYLCDNCFLVFVPKKFFPNTTREKNRYLNHQNSIENKGYVDFLKLAIVPALKYLKPQSAGLDFGCGPLPVLSQLLAECNFKCDNYDPLFFPELNSQKCYNFIFATECFEHFFNPESEIKLLLKILKPGGHLVVMTERWETHEKFSTWTYARDETHVAFYHTKTFEYIAKRYQFETLFEDRKRVIILKKL